MPLASKPLLPFCHLNPATEQDNDSSISHTQHFRVTGCWGLLKAHVTPFQSTCDSPFAWFQLRPESWGNCEDFSAHPWFANYFSWGMGGAEKFFPLEHFFWRFWLPWTTLPSSTEWKMTMNHPGGSNVLLIIESGGKAGALPALGRGGWPGGLTGREGARCQGTALGKTTDWKIEDADGFQKNCWKQIVSQPYGSSEGHVFCTGREPWCRNRLKSWKRAQAVYLNIFAVGPSGPEAKFTYKLFPMFLLLERWKVYLMFYARRKSKINVLGQILPAAEPHVFLDAWCAAIPCFNPRPGALHTLSPSTANARSCLAFLLPVTLHND